MDPSVSPLNLSTEEGIISVQTESTIKAVQERRKLVADLRYNEDEDKGSSSEGDTALARINGGLENSSNGACVRVDHENTITTHEETHRTFKVLGFRRRDVRTRDVLMMQLKKILHDTSRIGMMWEDVQENLRTTEEISRNVQELQIDHDTLQKSHEEERQCRTKAELDMKEEIQKIRLELDLLDSKIEEKGKKAMLSELGIREEMQNIHKDLKQEEIETRKENQVNLAEIGKNTANLDSIREETKITSITTVEFSKTLLKIQAGLEALQKKIFDETLRRQTFEQEVFFEIQRLKQDFQNEDTQTRQEMRRNFMDVDKSLSRLDNIQQDTKTTLETVAVLAESLQSVHAELQKYRNKFVEESSQRRKADKMAKEELEHLHKEVTDEMALIRTESQINLDLSKRIASRVDSIEKETNLISATNKEVLNCMHILKSDFEGLHAKVDEDKKVTIQNDSALMEQMHEICNVLNGMQSVLVEEKEQRRLLEMDMKIDMTELNKGIESVSRKIDEETGKRAKTEKHIKLELEKIPQGLKDIYKRIGCQGAANTNLDMSPVNQNNFHDIRMPEERIEHMHHPYLKTIQEELEETRPCSDTDHTDPQNKEVGDIEEIDPGSLEAKFMDHIKRADFNGIQALLEKGYIPPLDIMQHVIDLHGHRRPIRFVLSKMAKSLLLQIPEADKVWAGYDALLQNTPIFVVSVDNDVDLSNVTTIDSFGDYSSVIHRNRNTHDPLEDVPGTHLQMRHINQVLNLIPISQFKMLLQEHSNLLYFGLENYHHLGTRLMCSVDKSDRTNLVLLVYVPLKGIIPVGEFEFPSEICNVPVKVRNASYPSSLDEIAPMARMLMTQILMKFVKEQDSAATMALLERGLVPNSEFLQEEILVQGHCKGLAMLLSEMASYFASCISEQCTAWAGYRHQKAEKPVFCIILENESKTVAKETLPMAFQSYDCIIRHKNMVSNEDKIVQQAVTEYGKQIPSEEVEKMHQCIAKNSESLLSCHSNITGIGLCSFRSIGYGTDKARLIEETCIVLSVTVKGLIPFGEYKFPSVIDGIAVDVREGGFVLFSGLKAQAYYQHVRMGCAISINPSSFGTLGGFVDLPRGSIGCITSAHCFMPIDESSKSDDGSMDGLELYDEINRNCIISQAVYQPDATVEASEFGKVSRIALKSGDAERSGVDAALIEITDPERTPDSGLFPDTDSLSLESQMIFDTGFLGENKDILGNGDEVIMFGSSSGIRRGRLRQGKVIVRRNKISTGPIPSTMFNQYEVHPVSGERFATDGDSGALVFHGSQGNLKNLRAIGMVIGGTLSNNTVVTPIRDIFKALELECEQFKMFPALDTE
ncbi:hypothetical protein CHS0354_031179 [Potamilus streckersoni]|uniref:Uncharacterized protein n=1 Tax=Potamilus streckersoni TaxID=2493646 RepID=A0AAE0TLF4_9BIVA|nr:hypothetical protein CHS0354_031179 [Potamilus streckersoni]